MSFAGSLFLRFAVASVRPGIEAFHLLFGHGANSIGLSFRPLIEGHEPPVIFAGRPFSDSCPLHSNPLFDSSEGRFGTPSLSAEQPEPDFEVRSTDLFSHPQGTEYQRH